MDRTGILIALVSAFFLAACQSAEVSHGWSTTVDTLPGGALHTVGSPPAADPGPTWGVVTDELDVPYLVRAHIVEAGL